MSLCRRPGVLHGGALLCQVINSTFEPDVIEESHKSMTTILKTAVKFLERGWK